MKALLIRPWVNKKITTVKNFLFGEPVGIECVSTVLKEAGIEVLLADFMVEKRGSLEKYMAGFSPDFIGITSQCTDVENVLLIASKAKALNPDITVCVGGVQANCFPDSFFTEDVDYVFKSTTRANIRQMADNIADGNPPVLIEGVYSRSLGFINEGNFCLNEYIIPDRECTKRYRSQYKYIGYQPCAVVQTAYGCRNRCTFCVRWKIEGDMLREVPIEEIAVQIESLDEPYVMICDNDFLINEKRLIRFCELMEERNIKKGYMCYGSVNSILEKPHLMRRLRDNGLLAVIVGYEAFEDERLGEYNKSATVSENKQATCILQQNGIACWGSFIVHPDWDKEDFNKMVANIRSLRPELMTFSPLVPHPLTPLYEQYRDRLIYSVEDYEKWNFGDVLIRPSQMTLKSYYIHVLWLALRVNTSFHSLRYALTAFPVKNTLRMVFGFRSLFSVYIKNIFTRGN